jgi:hypothetical protein
MRSSTCSRHDALRSMCETTCGSRRDYRWRQGAERRPDFASAYFYLRRDDEYLREVVAKVAMIAKEQRSLPERESKSSRQTRSMRRYYRILRLREFEGTVSPGIKLTSRYRGPPDWQRFDGLWHVSRRVPSFAVSYGVSNDIFPLHSEEMARRRDAAGPGGTLAIAKAGADSV